ncbi:MAG: Gfo/Idh/MocA family oxidoreductase [Bacteroidales bacterium]|nr:Gfo/Idh/MocA family oxidoreductase [Bacteroidales bacterium]
MTNRRDFLKHSILTGAGLLTMPNLLYSSAQRVAPSDKIKIGAIGVNGMGFSDLTAFLQNKECECIAMADIDDSVLAQRKNDAEKLQGSKVKNIYKDWRRVIDNKDVDLVIVGTPDHWHCIQMVAACQAGKDVYVEKPIGNTIEECNVMVRAAQKYNTVVQVGQWQRSDPHWQQAVDFVRSGKLGKIRTVRVFSYQGWCPSIPVKPDMAAPAGVDYDMWLGPAPLRPFNENRFHFTFRWFWDYAGGLMTDWGVHLLDYALYGMNVSTPKSIMAMGGKFGYPDDACETPDTLQTLYEFDDFTVLWDHAIGINDGAYGRTHGVAFGGENGTLVVDRGGWEVIPEIVNGNQRMEGCKHGQGAKDGDTAVGASGLDYHVRNHLDCMKRRDRNTNASIEIGSHICKFSALGNVAYRTGKKLEWNGSRFTNDEAANAYLTKEYRKPWGLPNV